VYVAWKKGKESQNRIFLNIFIFVKKNMPYVEYPVTSYLDIRHKPKRNRRIPLQVLLEHTGCPLNRSKNNANM
jgi:hypothetical protein